jgi:hypothetical protein
MYYNIKQFFKRIYNLYRWFPIIWKDQDWDQHYIYEIFKFKLKNQAEHIGGNNRHLDAKRHAEIMLLCCRLIDKIDNDEYLDEVHKCQEVDFTVDKDGHLNVETLWEDFKPYFAKYKKSYNQVMNMKTPPFNLETDFGIAIAIGVLNHNRAKSLLFRILDRNISRWWD